MKRLVVIGALMLAAVAQAQTRWEIVPDSNVISMDVAANALPHADHIEMSGKKMAVVLYWDVDSAGTFGLNRSLVFPMLRTVPNDTHASLMLHNDLDLASMLRVNGKRVPLASRRITINGDMEVISGYTNTDSRGAVTALDLSRVIFPSMEHPAMTEIYTARNVGTKSFNLLVPSLSQSYVTDISKGTEGSYVVQTDVGGSGSYNLMPGDSAVFYLTIQAYPQTGGKPLKLNPKDELAARRAFLAAIDGNLILETPDKTIDTEFRYAKIRGA